MSLDSHVNSDEILARIDEALGAAHMGAIGYDENGGVLFSTPGIDELLHLNPKSSSDATLRSAEGDVLHSLLDCKSLPVTVHSIHRGQERVLKINGSLEQRVFLVEDLSTQLQHGNTERGLLDMVAHDLRAGLMPLKTYAQMLAGGSLGPLTAAQIDVLQAIDRCVQRQADKIANVLDTIKCQEKRLELNLEPVNLADIVRQTFRASERDFKRRNIRTVIDVSPASPVIEGDISRLQRIFSSLASRALKQANTNGAIGVEICRVDSRARVRFWDSGGGKAGNEIKTLLTSARESTLWEQQPNVDLAFVFDVVGLHRGAIHASSEEDAGTTITLYFPLEKRTQAVAAESAGDLKGGAKQPLNALVADADSTESARLKELLEARGIEVALVSEAKAALLAVRERHFALVFISDTLQGMEHEHLRESIQTERPENPQRVFSLIRGAPFGGGPRGTTRPEIDSEFNKKADEISAELARILQVAAGKSAEQR